MKKKTLNTKKESVRQAVNIQKIIYIDLLMASDLQSWTLDIHVELKHFSFQIVMNECYFDLMASVVKYDILASSHNSENGVNHEFSRLKT